MILEIFVKLLELCLQLSRHLFEVGVVTVQVIWNLCVAYYVMCALLFVINNAFAMVVIFVLFPAIVTTFISFFRGAFVRIHAGRRC